MNEPKLISFISVLKAKNFNVKKAVLTQNFVTNLLYFIKDNNTRLVCDSIKKLHKNDEDEIILGNLLSLMPLSAPIIDNLIKKDYFDDTNILKWIDHLYFSSSSIMNTIQKQKLLIRKESDFTNQVIEAEKEIKALQKEIEIHQSVLDRLQNQQKIKKNLLSKKENQEKEIKKIQGNLNVKSLKELGDIHSVFKKQSEDIKGFKKLLSENKKTYLSFPKDDEEA